jgi:hypothetical protein
MSAARTYAEKRFSTDIATHRMTVIKDDGIYRHLRFSRPGTNCYSFDILTWPGYLAYVGDMGHYVFQRTEDMFEFFRHDCINPSYWAEKIQAAGRDGVKEYSEDKARQWVQSWLDQAGASEAAREASKDITFDEGEDHVYQQLRDFDASDLDEEDMFCGWQEANFKDYTFHYIWCCLALVWAIKQYDAAKAAEVSR